MNSLNEELRRANDIKGWKVLGRYEATASRWREGQPCFASAHLQAHQLSGSAILEKLHNVNVCQINNQKTPQTSKGDVESFDVLQWIWWNMFTDCEKGLWRKRSWVLVKPGMNECHLTISPSASAQSSQAGDCRSSPGGTAWGSRSAQSGFPSGYMVGICHRHLAEHRTWQ